MTEIKVLPTTFFKRKTNVRNVMGSKFVFKTDLEIKENWWKAKFQRSIFYLRRLWRFCFHAILLHRRRNFHSVAFGIDLRSGNLFSRIKNWNLFKEGKYVNRAVNYLCAVNSYPFSLTHKNKTNICFSIKTWDNMLKP